MSLVSPAFLRWLLAPRTSWHAWRLVRTSQSDVSFDTAWRQTRIQLHPDEMPYRQHGHRPDSATRSSGQCAGDESGRKG